MCTATWQLEPHRLRFFFNRDELRTRGRGEIPQICSRGGVQLVAPRDRDAGGTWLAANEHGLVVALLNGYVEESLALDQRQALPSPDGGWLSRGELVFHAAQASTPQAAVQSLADLQLDRFRTFVLLALKPGSVSVRAAWLDGSLAVAPLPDDDMPISSSSFSTVEVLARRRETWDLMGVSRSKDRIAAHLEFHRQHDPQAGAHSVCMSRPDAATQCLTWIDIDDAHVCMHHYDGPPCDSQSSLHSVEFLRKQRQGAVRDQRD